jgi:phosphoglycolate phosphatase-like HAD superfamily hydrolase
MRVFLDFDGTVVNVFRRYHALLTDFWGDCVSLEDYVVLKRQKPHDRQLLQTLLQFSDDEFSRYLRFKREKMETRDYLTKDELNINPSLLRDFFDQFDMSVLSVRRSARSAHDQYADLGLEFLVETADILPPAGSATKRSWIERSHSEPFVMIGDSEVDMAAGSLTNGKGFFVENGLRSIVTIPAKIRPCSVFPNIEAALSALNPDQPSDTHRSE